MALKRVAGITVLLLIAAIAIIVVPQPLQAATACVGPCVIPRPTTCLGGGVPPSFTSATPASVITAATNWLSFTGVANCVLGLTSLQVSVKGTTTSGSNIVTVQVFQLAGGTCASPTIGTLFLQQDLFITNAQQVDRLNLPPAYYDFTSSGGTACVRIAAPPAGVTTSLAATFEYQ